MIYLDSAATSLQKPLSVAQASANAIRFLASPGRGCHKPSMNAANKVLDCRMLAASFFNVDKVENVIFTYSATHGLNIAINSLVKAGDKVLISGYEHNAVTRPLADLGAEIIIARSPLFDRAAALDAFRQNISNVSCCVCTYVSNVFGFILPIEEIATLCHEKRVPLIIDASQAAGTIPIDFSSLNCEFMAMPGHKGLLGPQGTGILLCNSNKIKPLFYGGTGSNSELQHMPDFLPDRLEAGTHNVAGIAGLYEGLRFLNTRAPGAISSHEHALYSYFVNALSGVPELRLFASNNPKSHTAVLSMISKKISCDLLAEKLSNAGICVRAGLHCAPCAHKTVGTLESGTVRFGISPFNTREELRFTAATIKKILNNQ